MKAQKIDVKIVKQSRHRNGISGEPFNVVIFRDNNENRTMLSVVFEEGPSYCAVFDLDLLKQDVIEMMENSWRGDYYENELRRLIAIENNAKGEEHV